MTINDCTKTELLYVIDCLEHALLSSGKYYIRRALIDVESRRDEAKYAEARKLSDLSHKKRSECSELLQPYEGQPIGDVPASVFKEAVKALKEAEAAERRWMKLMGIKPKTAQKGSDRDV